MESYVNCLLDDEGEFLNDCEEISTVTKKSWLNSTSACLGNLEKVKTKVYNFGISDTRDLKAVNMRNKKTKQETTDDEQQSSAQSLVCNVTEQKSMRLWGSNSSIPETVAEQTTLAAEKVLKSIRPGSAKCSSTKVRPMSGLKARPQSAKEPLHEEHVAGHLLGVKGAKYDPSGRPPKGIPSVSSLGWVGPPAGLKYTDRPPEGQSWKMEFSDENKKENRKMTHIPDFLLGNEEFTAPHTTPVTSPEPVHRKKRMFDLYIGNPYTASIDTDVSLVEGSDDDEEILVPFRPQVDTEQDVIPAENFNMLNEKEEVRLVLPLAEDEYDETDDLDTERLLQEADSISQKFDLKNILKANQNLTETTAELNTTLHSSQATSNLSQTSCTLTSQTSTLLMNTEEINENRTEKLYTKIIDENELKFNKNGQNQLERQVNLHEQDKSYVKFNEDVTTVNITPRNIGRKVEELNHNKKTTVHKTTNFVDLIEVRNRVETVLSTSKAELTPRECVKPLNAVSRPPSGKLKSSHSNSDLNNCKMMSSEICMKRITSQSKPRPASAPLYRMAKYIATVTVDYSPQDMQGPQNKDQKSNKKKKARKHNNDVSTLINRMSLDETDEIEDPLLAKYESHLEYLGQGVQKEYSVPILDITSAPVVCKSDSEKNYYEISRHSSMINLESLGKTECVPERDSIANIQNATTVVKTTKTIEFDQLKPKEISVKSVLESQMSKDKENFLESSPCTKERQPLHRPSSAKTQPKHSATLSSTLKTEDIKKNECKITIHKESGEKKTEKIGEINEPRELSEKEKQDRLKVIDNLLARTRALQVNNKKADRKTTFTTKISTPKQKSRPFSADSVLLTRATDHACKTSDKKTSASATIHRPLKTNSASTKLHKSSRMTKRAFTEPCIITSNIDHSDDKTEEELACLQMEGELAQKGVHISASTLQKALYPPSGKSKYYQITADLPKRSSLSLFSHPKVWLPEEYKKLQKAERMLSRANKIMFLQEKAEKRRVLLESLTPEEIKRRRHKSNKSGKKLKRNKSATVGHVENKHITE